MQTESKVPDSWPPDGLETLDHCPACGSQLRDTRYRDLPDRYYGTPGLWTMHRCRACGVSYLDPRPTGDTIGLAYRQYFTHDAGAGMVGAGRTDLRAALRNGYLNARYGSRLQPASALGAVLAHLLYPLRVKAERNFRHLPPPVAEGRLLDVGCGNGDFLADMAGLGWQAQGLETDPVAAKVAVDRGIPVVNGLLEEDTFPAERFDVITMHHVIEHLHYPRTALRLCRRFLRPGGLLSIATPNIDSFGHRTFGRDWFPLDPPRHLVLFGRQSLKQALMEEGFSQIYSPTSTIMNSPTYRASARNAAERLSGEWTFSKALGLKLGVAGLAAWVLPDLAEEVVAVARKPVST